MTNWLLRAAAAVLCSAGLALAQQEEAPLTYEAGGSAGFAMGRGLTVDKGSTSGTTGFQNGFLAGGLLGHNSGRFLGGEVRYLFRSGAAMLDVAGAKPTLGAQQHAFTYDLLWHFRQRGYAVRPFVSAGGGMKWVRGTGTETFVQPGSSFVALTATSEMLPAFGGGAGIKVRAGDRAIVRFEVRDLISTAPKKVLAPAPGAAVHGLFHDIMVLVSVAYRF